MFQTGIQVEPVIRVGRYRMSRGPMVESRLARRRARYQKERAFQTQELTRILMLPTTKAVAKKRKKTGTIIPPDIRPIVWWTKGLGAIRNGEITYGELPVKEEKANVIFLSQREGLRSIIQREDGDLVSSFVNRGLFDAAVYRAFAELLKTDVEKYCEIMVHSPKRMMPDFLHITKTDEEGMSQVYVSLFLAETLEEHYSQYAWGYMRLGGEGLEVLQWSISPEALLSLVVQKNPMLDNFRPPYRPLLQLARNMNPLLIHLNNIGQRAHWRYTRNSFPHVSPYAGGDSRGDLARAELKVLSDEYVLGNVQQGNRLDIYLASITDVVREKVVSAASLCRIIQMTAPAIPIDAKILVGDVPYMVRLANDESCAEILSRAAPEKKKLKKKPKAKKGKRVAGVDLGAGDDRSVEVSAELMSSALIGRVEEDVDVTDIPVPVPEPPPVNPFPRIRF